MEHLVKIRNVQHITFEINNTGKGYKIESRLQLHVVSGISFVQSLLCIDIWLNIWYESRDIMVWQKRRRQSSTPSCLIYQGNGLFLNRHDHRKDRFKVHRLSVA